MKSQENKVIVRSFSKYEFEEKLANEEIKSIRG